MGQFCPSCGARLEMETKPGSGIPHRVCPECSGGDGW
ncbi:zf-TFIIB domain-containing protein [Halolamina sp.]